MKNPRRKWLWSGLVLLLGAFLIARARPATTAMLRAMQDEGPARDAWQRPDEVMDALGIVAGSEVADVGCGDGYFVPHLSRRVGPQGHVEAEDIESGVLEKVRKLAEKQKLANVHTIHGSANDPQLPAGTLDAVLVVNAYHEFIQYDAMMQGMRKALKPGGRLGIIDAVGDERDSRATHQDKHTITEKLVREDAARNGFVFRRKGNDFHWPGTRRNLFFFLIFEKPA